MANLQFYRTTIAPLWVNWQPQNTFSCLFFCLVPCSQNIFWLFQGTNRSFVVATDNCETQWLRSWKTRFSPPRRQMVLLSPNLTLYFVSFWLLCRNNSKFSFSTIILSTCRSIYVWQSLILRLIRYEGRYILLQIDNNQIAVFTAVNLNDCLSLYTQWLFAAKEILSWCEHAASTF